MRINFPWTFLPVAAALMAPVTVNAQATPSAGAVEPRRSEVLHADVARADSILFDALFAQCDAERAIALLAADVEFYDDRTGLSVGDDLREDFRRLADNCPADHGVRRVLLPESVETRPIAGFGAVQTGVHHFVERGASTSTVARFTHIWKRVGDDWELVRIISLHEVVDATAVAEPRR